LRGNRAINTIVRGGKMGKIGLYRGIRLALSASCNIRFRSRLAGPAQCAVALIAMVTFLAFPLATAHADTLDVDLSNATVAGQVPIIVEFTASVEWINFEVDNAYAASASGPVGTFNWNSTGTEDGVHHIVALGFDGSGALAGYSDIELHVANSTPAVASDEPIQIAGSDDQWIKWVNLYVDGSYQQSTSGSSWAFTQSFAPGTHNLKVAGYYNSGELMAAAQVSSISFVSSRAVQASGSDPAPSYFSTIPSGSPLPSEAQCASWILSVPSHEITPSNTPYNQTVATSAELNALHQQPTWNPIEPASDFANVTGDFTGTTTQIIRWAACKWGIDENYMKADAYYQSTNSSGTVIWDQSTIWDWRTTMSECETPGWDGWGMYANFSTGSTQGCYQSYGIYQLKMTDFNLWSEARDSTSSNADFRGALYRGCLDGHIANYIANDPNSNHSIAYPNSDLNVMVEGCVGINASGHWYDSGAQSYIQIIENLLANPSWPST
jgi:hypothetical protein